MTKISTLAVLTLAVLTLAVLFLASNDNLGISSQNTSLRTERVVPGGATTYPLNGIIYWKGQGWYLPEGQLDPGNNYWDNTGNGVWIDDQNRLHLTVKNDNGTWNCTMVNSQNKYLYGTFTWTIASPVYTFDKNCVVGLFTYLDDNHELDIETTRWGNRRGNNLWYSVQPYVIEGNMQGYHVPSSIDGTNTTYRLDWQPNYIRFTASEADGTVISDFNYTNVSGIPKNPQGVVMNLWLNDAPPSDGKNIELIISDFTVTNNSLFIKQWEMPTTQTIPT